MSMNVGDSTDLIHGGGGGLRNFWRSRTDFEKKLLISMAVMALVIIGMTTAVIILAVNNSDRSSNPKASISLGKDTPQTISHSKIKEDEGESEKYLHTTPLVLDHRSLIRSMATALVSGTYLGTVSTTSVTKNTFTATVVPDDAYESISVQEDAFTDTVIKEDTFTETVNPKYTIIGTYVPKDTILATSVPKDTILATSVPKDPNSDTFLQLNSLPDKTNQQSETFVAPKTLKPTSVYDENDKTTVFQQFTRLGTPTSMTSMYFKDFREYPTVGEEDSSYDKSDITKLYPSPA